MKFNHIGLFTNNPRRLLNFYEGKLKFKKVYQTELSKKVIKQIFGINEDCFMARLVLDEMHVEIFWPKKKNVLKSRIPNAIGYNHFGVLVKNKQRYCRNLRDKYKVKVIEVDRGNRYIYFIEDPDKNLVEIME